MGGEPDRTGRVYPPEHRALFEEIASSEDSRMIWPFADDARRSTGRTSSTGTGSWRRSRRRSSSSRLTTSPAHGTHARGRATSGDPVWAMTAAPWMLSFCGVLDGDRARACATALLGAPAPQGARARLLDPGAAARPPLARTNGRARANVRIPGTPPEAPAQGAWTEEETAVFSALSTAPTPRRSRSSTGRASRYPPSSTALLTLSLKDVVVEGPDGFFRRRLAR